MILWHVQDIGIVLAKNTFRVYPMRFFSQLIEMSMIHQRGGSFFEILIALLVFSASVMGIMTQQWLLVRGLHHMQAEWQDLWETDNQSEAFSS